MVAFRQGLAQIGYVEGQNVAIEYRSAFGQFARLSALAGELVDRQVAVIVAGGFLSQPLAAKAATSTIPIVFAYGGDPVRDGLVASLNRPGGNVTGAAAINSELGGKRLDLLLNLVPQITTVAFLSPEEAQRNQMLAAARDLGRQVIILDARSVRDYEATFTTLVNRQAGALIVGANLFNPNKIVELAARYKIPTIYPRRDYVETGGLMSYAADYADIFRKGEKPADLPVVLPTKFELLINLKTAKALGLEIPPILLAIADEVIE
jgi:putative ABC transport system substrate-binding protein